MRKGQSAGVKFALTCVIKNAILHITKNEIIKMEHAMKKLVVQDTEISMKKIENKDYISLTDMIKAKDGDFFISDWLRNRNTLEFLGIWERIYNPAFNYGEFAIIKSQAGLNRFKISVKEWVTKTNAIGLKASAGRYGGTYAYKDIAFEFGMWISPEFKIYLIQEFERLKELEMKQFGWDVKRNLTKINYGIHTNAIKQNLIPEELSKEAIGRIYASEADILNMALFGMTAKEWELANPGLKGNIRDYASGAQLVCLTNLESLNSVMIEEGRTQKERIEKLNKVAIYQMTILTEDKRTEDMNLMIQKECEL